MAKLSSLPSVKQGFYESRNGIPLEIFVLDILQLEYLHNSDSKYAVILTYILIPPWEKSCLLFHHLLSCEKWIIIRCSSSVFLLGFDPHSPQTLHNTSCNPRAIHHGRIHKKSYSPYALCPSKSSLSCFKSSWDMDSSIFINFIQIWTGAVN